MIVRVKINIDTGCLNCSHKETQVNNITRSTDYFFILKMWTMAFNKGSVFNYRELTACVVDRSTHHTPFEHLDILLLHLWFPKWRGWWRAHLPMQEMQETWVRSLSWEDPLKKEMATHSSIHAWRFPWTEEPGGVQFMGWQRVWHDWATNTHSLRFLQSLVFTG